MKVFAPQISVKLVKASIRKDLVEGKSVDTDRYAGLAAINLTPYLADTGAVQTHKGVREVAGGFSITLADKPHRADEKSLFETIYALVEPMDLVEIRFCRNPADYEAGQPPVVMRGFVSEITRGETMAGDRPQRTVTISGQDFGKVMQILQIFFFNNAAVGDNILSELAFFHKYGEASDAKNKDANSFITSVVEKVVNPYLKDLVALADGSSVGAKVVNEWSVSANVEGTVSPYTVASIQNVSVDKLLEQVLDVGPFNEMYVEDLEDGIRLVLRPNPFLAVDGKPIQGVSPEVVEASHDEVTAIGITRTDVGVANYYWVTDSRWTMMSNEDAQLAGQIGAEQDYVLFEYPNAAAARYGIRKMEVQTLLGEPQYSQSDAVPAEQMPEQINVLGDWLAKRRKILADQNKDNVLFENGSITLRGNEKIKAGMQLRLTRENGVVSSFYIVRVAHNFAPYRGFTTSLVVERGTNFIERSQAKDANYFLEMGRSIT